MARRQVAIVPHTHWDREWYSPFQTFRLRLVDLMDEFLPQLESDLSYARFLLDGQMAVVDDYLEVRPEAEAVLQRLAAAGRLGVGPWYTLPDEFLVSGETHIRNLQMGLERATAFGGGMDVGYLPDMFGHIAQMPQILSQFGFGHTVVWRGVPAAIDRTAFWWEALDGTRVRAQYLARGGYGNGAGIPEDAKALVRRVEAHESELGDMLLPDGGLLFMNGTDHQVPQPWLGRVVAEANDIQDDYEFVVTSLPEFLAAATTDGLPEWKGELRSGARANLLMGVASNRLDTKQHAARAERALEQLAEPLCALFLPADQWPRSLLDIAWREVIRNAAHDSICACSDDEVVAAVNHRYAEARQIADGLAARAVKAAADSFAEPGLYVVNPSARARSATVEVVIPDDAPVPGTQALRARPATTTTHSMRPSDVSALLGRIRNQQLSDVFYVSSLSMDGENIKICLATEASPSPRVDEARRELYARLGQRKHDFYTVEIERPPMQRLLARVHDVPGFGWQRWSPESATTPAQPVTVEGTTMSNGLVTVEVDATTGTFAINGLAGFDRLVDGGDEGDTYNFNPPAGDVVVDVPQAVEVEVLDSGPVRASIEIRRTYVWPKEVVDGARTGEVPTLVTSRVELHADERLVRVGVRFHNASRDHRLRTHMPLATPATASRAECAFGIVERGLEAEGGPSEKPLATFPSRRFVSAGGVTVLHEGMLEYELVEGGTELAVTIVRCTGWLSRGPMAYRPEPAGPVVPAEGAQLQHDVEARYAIHVGDEDPYDLVDTAFLSVQVAPAIGGGRRGESGSELTVDGAQVSSLRRTPAGLELRVFNPTDSPTTIELGDRTGWLVDLRGRPVTAFEGGFELRPWGIATALLTDA